MSRKPTQIASLAVLCISVLLQCQCAQNRTEEHEPLSKDEARALAVVLANKSCLEQFSIEPFDASSYPIIFEQRRWRWGTNTLHGINGYSAVVSFDAHGDSVHVDVSFTTDALY